ncbi:MAG: hypothetical protein HUU26_12390 [Gemmatimonadaceae bacterium]|nr:hypothetical protein [Gemmatimonadaceae bacterium]
MMALATAAIGTPLAAQEAAIPPAAEQIAAAVLPLPAELRAAATVLGYNADGKLTPLRRGTNGMTCLARDPRAPQFHVACYHESMEPFMARGRELRESGITGTQVDTVRFREAKTGTLKLPSHPASLYSLTGGSFDAKTGTAPGARWLYVVYVPYATTATTGLSDKPQEGAPWLMFPGTPKAHIMFVPRM